MGIRVTQEVTEALVQPTNARLRGTQSAVEVLVLPNPSMRSTQSVVEALVQIGNPGIRVTQEVVEVLTVRAAPKYGEHRHPFDPSYVAREINQHEHGIRFDANNLWDRYGNCFVCGKPMRSH